MGTRGDACPLGFLLIIIFCSLPPWSIQGSDKCVEPNQPDCGPNAKFNNVFWGYFCTCIDGYESSSGQLRFMSTSENDCREVSQLTRGRQSLWTGPWTPYVTLQKTRYHNSHVEHVTSIPKSRFNCRAQLERIKKRHGNFSWQGQLSNSSSFSTFLNSNFKNLNSMCGDRSAASSLAQKTYSFNTLLISTSTWVDWSEEEVASAVDITLQSVKVIILATVYRNPKRMTQTVTKKAMAVETRLVTQDCSRDSEVIRLSAYNETMEIHCETVTEAATQGVGAAAAFISYSTLDSIINTKLFCRRNPPGWGKLGNSHLNSRVVSGAIGDEQNVYLSRSVNFTLLHTEAMKDKEALHCVYWKFKAGKGSWSPDGCTILHTNSTHTKCSCHHLSSFAILMAPNTAPESLPLTIITYMGLTLALLCLFLTILTFLLCRSICNISTSIHLQLCFCLFLADLVLLAEVDKNSTWVACTVITGFLHYLFLACFTWMLLEGLHLFLTVRNLQAVNYTSASRFKKRFMYPFGYGFPALIVTISAAVKPHGYGSCHYCWLNLETGFYWSFLRPVCAIILINLTCFALTLWILRSKFSALNTDLSTLRDYRLLTFKAIAQVFILGCTWSLGVFQVSPAATVMAYLFTIVNSLQGAFIFLVHCLLNRQVREEYQQWIKRLRRSGRRSGQITGYKMGSN